VLWFLIFFIRGDDIFPCHIAVSGLSFTLPRTIGAKLQGFTSPFGSMKRYSPKMQAVVAGERIPVLSAGK
jgi:hypothetical protein